MKTLIKLSYLIVLLSINSTYANAQLFGFFSGEKVEVKGKIVNKESNEKVVLNNIYAGRYANTEELDANACFSLTASIKDLTANRHKRAAIKINTKNFGMYVILLDIDKKKLEKIKSIQLPDICLYPSKDIIDQTPTEEDIAEARRNGEYGVPCSKAKIIDLGEISEDMITYRE
jgi:hypothetical protein